MFKTQDATWMSTDRNSPDTFSVLYCNRFLVFVHPETFQSWDSTWRLWPTVEEAKIWRNMGRILDISGKQWTKHNVFWILGLEGARENLSILGIFWNEMTAWDIFAFSGQWHRFYLQECGCSPPCCGCLQCSLPVDRKEDVPSCRCQPHGRVFKG